MVFNNFNHNSERRGILEEQFLKGCINPIGTKDQ